MTLINYVNSINFLVFPVLIFVIKKCEELRVILVLLYFFVFWFHWFHISSIHCGIITCMFRHIFMAAFFLFTFARQARHKLGNNSFVGASSFCLDLQSVLVLLDNSVLDIILKAAVMDAIHERRKVVVQAGSFRHPGDELPWLVFSYLHVFVYDLILALVA